MENLNDILSQDRRIPLLSEGQKAEFRLAIFGSIDPVTGQPVRKPGYGLAAEDQIIDQGKSKMIFNVLSWEFSEGPGGVEVKKPIKKMVIFPESGVIICTPTGAFNNDTYLYLKNHNKNRNNPYRKPGSGVVFYEVNEKRDISIAKNSFEYKILAGGHVMMAKTAQMDELVKNLNDSGRKELYIDPALKGMNLRRTLENLSQSFSSEILLFSGDTDRMMRVIVDYAINEQWIVFNDNEKVLMWQWTSLKKPSEKIGNKKTARDIVAVPADGDDPREYLQSYFASEQGSLPYAELRAEYKKLFNLVHI